MSEVLSNHCGDCGELRALCRCVERRKDGGRTVLPLSASEQAALQPLAGEEPVALPPGAKLTPFAAETRFRRFLAGFFRDVLMGTMDSGSMGRGYACLAVETWLHRLFKEFVGTKYEGSVSSLDLLRRVGLPERGDASELPSSARLDLADEMAVKFCTIVMVAMRRRGVPAARIVLDPADLAITLPEEVRP